MASSVQAQSWSCFLSSPFSEERTELLSSVLLWCLALESWIISLEKKIDSLIT